MVARADQHRHLAHLPLVRQDDHVAKVARTVARYRDPRPVACRRERKPVVGICIGIRVPDYFIPIVRVRTRRQHTPAVGVEPGKSCSKAIAVKCHRPFVDQVVEPVAIPVVRIDASIVAHKVVASDGEVSVAAQNNLRVHAHIRIAAREEPLPCDRSRPFARCRPQAAFSLNGKRVAQSGRSRKRGAVQRVLKPPVHKPPEGRCGRAAWSVWKHPACRLAADAVQIDDVPSEVRPRPMQVKPSDVHCVRRHGKGMLGFVCNRY